MYQEEGEDEVGGLNGGGGRLKKDGMYEKNKEGERGLLREGE